MVHVITDSTSSLPKDVCRDLGIEILSLTINRDGKEYIESETDLDNFYENIYEMADNIPTSSQPPLSKIQEALQRAIKSDKEILGIFISNRMSGTFEGFLQVACQTKSSLPGFRFAAIDSMTNCMEMGWPIIAAAKAAKAGEGIEKCVAAAQRSLLSTRFVFVPESLTFLEKGGRIGKAAALLGSLINIAPILTVKDGEAGVLSKVRSQKRALAKMVQTLESDISNYGLKNLAVHYIGDKEPALKWAKESIEPILGFTPLVLPASPVIGVHVGPAMGIAYECEKPIPGKFTVSEPEVVM